MSSEPFDDPKEGEEMTRMGTDEEESKLLRPLIARRREGKLPNAERDANPISKAFLFFVYPLLSKAEKLDADMTIDEIDLPHGMDSAIKARDRFEPIWNEELEKNPDSPSLAWALFKFLWRQVCVSTFWGLIEAGGPFTSVVLMKFINDFVVSSLTGDPDPDWHGGLMVVVFFLLQVIYTIGAAQGMRSVARQEMRIEGALKMLMVKKAVMLSGKGMKTAGGTGAMFQLFSTDVATIAQTLPHVWRASEIGAAVIGAFVYLFIIVGWPAIAALVLLCIVVPFNYRISNTFITYFIQKMKAGDARTNKVVEIINAVRVIKFYAWEKPFRDIVRALREPELVIVSKLMRQIAILLASFAIAAPLMQVAMYFVLVYGAERPSVLVFFQSLSIITILSLVMVRAPFIYSAYLQGKAAITRITGVLVAEERNDKNYSVNANVPLGTLEIEGGCFSWPLDIPQRVQLPPGVKLSKEQAAGLEAMYQAQVEAAKNAKPVYLEDVSFKAAKGELVMIVGKVGSGKSSLVNALLSEMSLETGAVNRNGTVAYVPQSAWILNATIRNNILVNYPYDEARYHEVLAAVDLFVDLKTLPNGDLTEVGEKGINLSGGQKQRVSLARALYANADIYIFDDPLSALDAHVGRHVFDVAIQDLLKDKTRVLVTHQMQYLQFANRVYVADKMKIREEQVPEDIPAEETEDESPLVSMFRAFNATSSASPSSPKPETPANVKKKLSTPMAGGAGGKDNETGKLTAKEERHSGAVKNKTLFTYLGSFGSPIFWVVIFGLQTLVVCANIFSQLWMGWWTEGKWPDLNEKYPPSFFLGIYSAAMLFAALCTLARELYWRGGAVNAPRSLYDRMTNAVLHAPMAFFDTTPVGRIINRFTRDAQQLDFQLPMAANQTINLTFTFLGSAAAICYAVPWATPVFVFAIIIIVLVQPSISIVILRRVSSAATGPVFALYSESLAGAVSIRSQQITDFCTERFALYIDERNGSFFSDRMAFEAVRARVNLVMAFVAAMLLLVIMLTREDLDPTIVIFAINNSTTVTLFMGYVMMQRGQLMMSLNSIERMMDFTELEPEQSGNNEAPEAWPTNGNLEFRKVTAQYRPGLPTVLNEVSFHIKGGEKIGVVGRTGSGKSSLLLTIFRIIPILGNSKILIDGVDTATIPLEQLRSKVSAIPQEPVLFAGTVRTNLDPFEKTDKEALRKAIGLCHLKDPLEELRVKQAGSASPTVKADGSVAEAEELDILDVKLGDGDLSIGQKQLLCLARAVARGLKILVLDEATSSVDVHTDAMIQETIRTVFRDATIITVAHRLNTIMDSDRIIVLDAGNVAEMGTPQALLENENSIFAGLAAEATEQESAVSPAHAHDN